MNKFSVYILMILIFLGLSKGVTVSEKGPVYIDSEEQLALLCEGRPSNAILIDYFKTGLVIKSYYQKYKIIEDLNTPRIITVRTNRFFLEKHDLHIGMSIFARDHSGKEYFTPNIPGLVFIDRPSLGSWKKDASDQKYWSFYRSYRHLKTALGWGNLNPSYAIFETAKFYRLKGLAYFGPHDEFGTNGKITREVFPDFFHKVQKNKIGFSEFIKKLLRTKSKWIYHERTL